MQLKKIYKKILITGGTGSFGNVAVKKFLNQKNINEIRIFSRDELKQDQMRKYYNNKKLKFIIGDVRDREALINVTKSINLVFHAAALKQVPSCEFFPEEAVKTNILGSKNLIDASVSNKVSKIILLSTDKAVEPINAMGMSKALMEKLAISYSKRFSENVSTICCVRYGNVLSSRGSVIPLFLEQIKSNKPITITHKDMTRFLLFLDDAIDLVIYAANNAKNGDILVKKAPAAKILDVANVIYKLMNKNPNFKFIGIRHGEKTHETLISKTEMINTIDKGDFYKIPIDTRDLNYQSYFIKGRKKLNLQIDYNSSQKNINQKKIELILKRLLKK